MNTWDKRYTDRVQLLVDILPVHDFADLYAGELAAALSRQHPHGLYVKKSRQLSDFLTH